MREKTKKGIDMLNKECTKKNCSDRNGAKGIVRRFGKTTISIETGKRYFQPVYKCWLCKKIYYVGKKSQCLY
jgi:hypothetical protein